MPASSCQPPPTSLPHQKKTEVVALEIYLLGTKEVPHIRGFTAGGKSGSSNPNWQVTHSSLFRTISYIIANSVTQHSRDISLGNLNIETGGDRRRRCAYIEKELSRRFEGVIYTREKILNTQRLQRPRLWEKAVSDALHTATITVRNDIGIHIKNNTTTVNSRLSGHLDKTVYSSELGY